MIDTDGVDYAVRFASDTLKTADPLATVSEGADTFYRMGAVKGGRNEVPDGVRRPWVV